VRILLVNHEFSMSGAAVMLLDLADVLQQQGHSLAVGPMDPMPGPMRTEYERRGIPIHESVKGSSFDMMIANTLSSAPAVFGLSRALPTLWWLHETAIALDLLARNPAWREAFDLAHRIVTPSAWIRDNVFRSYLYQRLPDDVVVVPNGIRQRPVTAADPRSRRWRIVCCGTVHIAKRQGDLIAALARLGRADVELILVGLDIALPDDARQIVEVAPERYRLLGQRPREEALGWIASADAVALVSHSENHALSLGEAAFAGVPVLLSDLPVFEEQGWRHGENCLMHPVGNVPMLADNIDFLLGNDDERQRLAKAGARMRRRYDFDVFAARMSEVIASLAAGRV